MQEYLVTKQVKWKFNVSRCPWVGWAVQKVGGVSKIMFI